MSIPKTIGFLSHFIYDVKKISINRRKGSHTMDGQFKFLDTNRLLTADEVARIFIYSRSNAYRLMKQQKIRTVHMVGGHGVWLSDLKKYIKDEKTSAKKKKS
jgi:hypothetical protein